MWVLSNGKSNSRQRVQADQDLADIWKCHLPVSLQREETELQILAHGKFAGFSLHVLWRLFSFFSQKALETRNLELSQILQLSFLILKSTDEKSKGDENLFLLLSTSRQQHLELLVIKIPSSF